MAALGLDTGYRPLFGLYEFLSPSLGEIFSKKNRQKTTDTHSSDASSKALAPISDAEIRDYIKRIDADMVLNMMVLANKMLDEAIEDVYCIEEKEAKKIVAEHGKAFQEVKELWSNLEATPQSVAQFKFYDHFFGMIKRFHSFMYALESMAKPVYVDENSPKYQAFLAGYAHSLQQEDKGDSQSFESSDELFEHVFND